MPVPLKTGDAVFLSQLQKVIVFVNGFSGENLVVWVFFSFDADLKSESDCGSFVEDRKCVFPFLNNKKLYSL